MCRDAVPVDPLAILMVLRLTVENALGHLVAALGAHNIRLGQLGLDGNGKGDTPSVSKAGILFFLERSCVAQCPTCSPLRMRWNTARSSSEALLDWRLLIS